MLECINCYVAFERKGGGAVGLLCELSEAAWEHDHSR